jgi:hypothetical protein
MWSGARSRPRSAAQQNLRLSTAGRQATTENAQLRNESPLLEDDLAAARTSLRRMIRTQSR